MSGVLCWTAAAAAPEVPPAAAILAHRLQIGGGAVVGNQPGGQGGPWAIWLRIPRGSVKSANGYLTIPPIGQALSAGTRGARGAFHYYYPGSVPSGRDVLHGRAVTSVQALTIARSWLRRAGVATPRGMLRIATGGNATVTWLCCFKAALAVVSWGEAQDQSGRINASAEVDVANGGTVVQADVHPGTIIGPHLADEGLSSPCPGRTRQDNNGVAVGPWCFYYPAAANLQMIDSIGAHLTWASDPRYTAWSFDHGSRLRVNDRGPLHVVTVTPDRAVYWVRERAATYRLTLVPAFPGLVDSVWELTDVGRL